MCVKCVLGVGDVILFPESICSSNQASTNEKMWLAASHIPFSLCVCVFECEYMLRILRFVSSRHPAIELSVDPRVREWTKSIIFLATYSQLPSANLGGDRRGKRGVELRFDTVRSIIEGRERERVQWHCCTYNFRIGFFPSFMDG